MVARKSCRKIRLCLDSKQLNKLNKREMFRISTIEEILSELTGATVFSVLDANKGFYQIPLIESSKRLCSFATPLER